MNMTPPPLSPLISAIFCWLISLGLLACSTDPSRGPGLYFEGETPVEIEVGETTGNLQFTKIVVTSATGKTETRENYVDVELASPDTNLVQVSGLKLKGIKPGNNIILTAITTSGTLETVEFPVNVVSP